MKTEAPVGDAARGLSASALADAPWGYLLTAGGVNLKYHMIDSQSRWTERESPKG